MGFGINRGSEDMNIFSEQTKKIKELVNKPDKTPSEEEDLLFQISIKLTPFMTYYDQSQSKALCKILTYEEYPTGTILVKEEREAQAVYYILEGECEVFKKEQSGGDSDDEDVKESEENINYFANKVAILQSGCCFGEEGVIMKGKREATVVCSKPTAFLIADAKAFRKIMFLDKQHSTILIQKYLSSNLYFSLFSQQTIRQIAQSCNMQSFDPGEIIVTEHDPINNLYFIKSGTVKIIKLVKFYKKELESYSNVSTSNSNTNSLIETKKIDKKSLLYSDIEANSIDFDKIDLEEEVTENTPEEESKNEPKDINEKKNNSDINDFINDLNINHNLTKFDSYSNMKRPKRNDEPVYNLLHIATISSGYFPELSIAQPWTVRTLQRLRVAAEQNHLKHAYASVIAEKRCECVVCPVVSFITCLQEYERNALPMCFDNSFDNEQNVDDIYKQSKNAIRDLITSSSGFMNIPYENLRNAFINEKKWEIFKKETVEEVWNAHKANQERKRNKFWFMK